ncbi:uncharacterized protein [Branchiostoma lanceolatum]|uniref:uncharacterized protein n=1 Tax=Branchiostoma lanceolatum TaxID=7740 RepID=UPI0034566867
MGDNCSKHVKLPEVDGTTFKKYKFPFENLVLQGGGAWGVCQVGALKVLDDAGILQNIKRFGGTSVGAVVAGLLAVGMAPQELADKLNENLKDIAYDKPPSHWYDLPIPDKYVADIWYLYNLTHKFGIMPGEAFLDWYGKTIEEHLHAKGFDSLNGDINFWQVYDVLGKELCTVSYETEFTSEVYSHVKTSPLLEIKKAVRMSMSIPVIFQAYQSSFGNIQPRHIDGGVSAGYPIYCFEGWWLSMDQAKTFAKRLEGKDAEKKINFLPGVSRKHFDVVGSDEDKEMVREKTVGLAMFTDIHPGGSSQELFEKRIEECLEENPKYKEQLEIPSTKLANKYHEKQVQLKKTRFEFAKELEEGFTVGDKIKEVAAAYPDEAEMERIFYELTDEQMEIISITAGMDGKPDKEAVFKLLFLDYDGNPTTALASDIYDNQMPLQQAKNDCLKGNFAETPMELYGQFMQFVGKNKPMEEYDVGRSVGINCSYVGMLNFDLETKDKEFLMAQGAVAALAFLEDWVSKHPELEEVPVQQTTTA